MRRRSAVRLAAAVLVTAAAGLALPSAPASAAGCSSSTGVTVVVDYNELGGGTQELCDASGGGDLAASLFTSNGFPLTYAQRQPGFVCRVSGVPASDPCVNTSPANAYWGLWWSDGKSGTWDYASTGAGSLRIPDGGYVAFAWDGSDGQALPGSAPTPHPAAPSPTPTHSPSAPPSTPSPGDSGGGNNANNGNNNQGGSGGADPTSSPTTQATSPSASDSPTGDPTGTPTGKPTRTPSEEESSAGAAVPSGSASSPAADESVEPSEGTTAAAADDGLPVWLTPVLIGLIFVAAGTTLWHRRRLASSR